LEQNEIDILEKRKKNDLTNAQNDDMTAVSPTYP
jgi:hypothetical protein